MRYLLAILCAVAVQDKPALPPEPDATAQKETLKQIKDLFKDDYARKGAMEQSALSQKLLQKGLDTNDDPASKFVFLKEARDVAAAAGDADTAIRAAHELGQAFAVDGAALKLAVVAKMASTIRDAEAARTLAKTCIPLVHDAVRADSYEAAASMVAKVEGVMRTAQDPTLAARVADLKKDVASLRDEYGRVKPMLEKPGTGDAEAVGRYLCFVKGDWAGGLPHLLAGAKVPLKTVVEKDVLNPVDADKQVEVADAWAEVAQKEKSAWRKTRIQSRVRTWLEKAQPNATGVLKMRIEKKLGEMEEAEPGSINLLRLIDLGTDAFGGLWTMENGVLVSGNEEWARCQLPYTPPDEYDLTLVATRKEGMDALGIGLGQGKTVFSIWVDGFPAMGGLSGLDQLDGSLMENSPAAVKGKFLTNNKPSRIAVSVRKTGVSASVDGKPLLNWQGSYTRLSRSVVWQPRDPKAPLILGAFGSRYHFSTIMLFPVTGQGKKLR